MARKVLQTIMPAQLTAADCSVAAMPLSMRFSNHADMGNRRGVDIDMRDSNMLTR